MISSSLCWRLDRANFATSWDSGEGAFRFGGRWNAKGKRTVYASYDAATAILEVAVHKGFHALDAVPQVITSFSVNDPTDIFVVSIDQIPNPNWLVPAVPTPAQQAYGDGLMNDHIFVAIPSVVSRHSWNLIFDADRARGKYTLIKQERFALDPRLAK